MHRWWDSCPSWRRRGGDRSSCRCAASAKPVEISGVAEPGGQSANAVRHDLTVAAPGRLDVWVSARGFAQPANGTLPPGTWSYECCPSQTAGTPAWHFRSSTVVAPGSYRFRATTRSTGTYLSTAVVAGSVASVWVRIRS